jgi:acetyl esterase
LPSCAHVGARQLNSQPETRNDAWMTLHPQLAELLASLHAAGYGYGDWSALPLPALRAAARSGYVPVGPAVSTRTLEIDGPAGPLSLHVYEPPQSPGLNSGLVFFSAGGYAVGELSGHAALCQQLAISAGCVVVTTELRLAPEHKFPAPVLDAYAVTSWVHENADELGIDPRRLAVGGESSGATLATAVCRLAKERRNPPLTFQLLLYPILDLRLPALTQLQMAAQQSAADQPEAERHGALLNAATLSELAKLYIDNDADRDDPRCSPLTARNLIGLPPALIISGEHDLLREQAASYASLLRTAYVPVTHSEYAGVGHGFLHLFALLDRGREALVECSAALRTAYAKALTDA